MGKGRFLPQGVLSDGKDRQVKSPWQWDTNGIAKGLRGREWPAQARWPRKAFTQEGKRKLALRDILTRDRSNHGCAGAHPNLFFCTGAPMPLLL